MYYSQPWYTYPVPYPGSPPLAKPANPPATDITKPEVHYIRAPLRCPPLESPAPPFRAEAVREGRLIEVNSEDYRNRWLLLFFYSSDFTFI